jgi:hypothetical protein
VLVALVAAALIPTAPTCHPSRTWSVLANLDGDPAKELVRAYDRHDCQHERYSAEVTVRERCADLTKFFPLVEEPVVLRDFRVVDVDHWTARREVFFFAGDRAKIVRFVNRRGGCSSPVELFTVTGASSVVLADLTPRYRGLELRVVVNGKRTTFRYARAKRRYVPYG